MRILLAITTFNNSPYTADCLRSIADIPSDYVPVIFDDFSTDDTAAVVAGFGRRFMGTARPMGLTHNWNRAYLMFKQEGYDGLIIANNDVLIPPGALYRMTALLPEFRIVAPLSTLRGTGHNEVQAIGRNSTINDRFAAVPDHYLLVQERLEKENSCKPPRFLRKFNGFFFALSRAIIEDEFQPDLLFNPENINTGNETDLYRRSRQKPVLCPTAFIFHYKAVSCFVDGEKDERNNLRKYHTDYNWEKE